MELSPRQQAFLDLARAQLRLDRSMREVIEPALRGELDLGMRPMFVLTAIDRGARHPGAVARRLNLPAPSVTRTVESLVHGGLVERHRSRTDRRSVDLALTGRGVEVVARARAVLARALADAWPDLDVARVGDLARGLDDLVDTLREP